VTSAIIRWIRLKILNKIFSYRFHYTFISFILFRDYNIIHKHYTNNTANGRSGCRCYKRLSEYFSVYKNKYDERVFFSFILQTYTRDTRYIILNIVTLLTIFLTVMEIINILHCIAHKCYNNYERYSMFKWKKGRGRDHSRDISHNSDKLRFTVGG
jgi:hypothetical protein